MGFTIKRGRGSIQRVFVFVGIPGIFVEKHKPELIGSSLIVSGDQSPEIVG